MKKLHSNLLTNSSENIPMEVKQQKFFGRKV